MIFRHNITRCYDCYPRPRARTFQVCTLRTLPDKPIHCLVWGKHLFSLLFGPSSDDNLLNDLLDSLKNKEILESASPAEEVFKVVDKIFQKLYIEMPQDQINANPEKFKNLKPLDLDTIRAVVTNLSSIPAELPLLDNDKVHSLSSYILDFYSRPLRVTLATAVHLLTKKIVKSELQEFEKDDDTHIRFTIASANLRSNCFNIPLVTE